MGSVPRRILPVVIVAVFMGTSPWLAGNAVIGDLERLWRLSPDAVTYVTSSVQLGFIAGTLLFAVLTVSDLFSPRKVFLVCSLLVATSNASIDLFAHGFTSLMVCRFLTGFFLAGIYPVGMRAIAGWYREDLGKALGYLLGGLVLGTAFPQLVEALGGELPWSRVIITISAVAATGGVLMYLLVPDGPHLSASAKLDPGAFRVIFASRRLRASAFGYFGHMWELYAFWAFVPVLLAVHVGSGTVVRLDIAFWSFVVIGAGSIGCVVGGLLSGRFGSARIAFAQLAVSGVCCLVSPFLIEAPTGIFLLFLVVWGITVVGDSPQFSSLNALNAPSGLVGSALTIVNCIGFSITIISIQLLGFAGHYIDTRWLFPILAIGPIVGLFAMRVLLPGESRYS